MPILSAFPASCPLLELLTTITYLLNIRLLFKGFHSYNIHILRRIYSFRANRYHTGITNFLLFLNYPFRTNSKPDQDNKISSVPKLHLLIPKILLHKLHHYFELMYKNLMEEKYLLFFQSKEWQSYELLHLDRKSVV